MQQAIRQIPGAATAAQEGGHRKIVFRQGVSPSADYAGVSDTYLSDYAAGDTTANVGQSALLLVRSGSRRVVLLRFDVSAIPPSATVSAASLSLYVDRQTDGSLPLPVAAHSVLRSWIADEATWLSAADGAPWGGAGASAATDRDLSAAATQTLPQAGVWYDLDLRDMVQRWVSEPAANRSVLVAGQTGSGLEFARHSSDSANPSLRPKLVVTYSP